ncbi:hypothetical protein [Sphingobacterium sp. LZ4M12]|uniref:hypothetical protein n=1 Tax=Sphingobacterium sp. LZ4M12 TaxID=2961940 RepID=UPI0020C3A508|nr:hypothetical protein [Sphingobacterium sp. LZ4M12]
MNQDGKDGRIDQDLAMNQDSKDGRIGLDYGYEPGWEGWEDRPRLWPIYRYIGIKLNWGKLISVSDLSNKKILGRGTSGF